MEAEKLKKKFKAMKVERVFVYAPKNWQKIFKIFLDTCLNIVNLKNAQLN